MVKWGQKMAIFADLQCYSYWRRCRWVAGPKKSQKHADVVVPYLGNIFHLSVINTYLWIRHCQWIIKFSSRISKYNIIFLENKTKIITATNDAIHHRTYIFYTLYVKEKRKSQTESDLLLLTSNVWGPWKYVLRTKFQQIKLFWRFWKPFSGILSQNLHVKWQRSKK